MRPHEQRRRNQCTLAALHGNLVDGLADTLRVLLDVHPRSRIDAAIAVGGLLSGLVAAPALVVASIAAFILSETADLAVFTPLQHRGLVFAVAGSSVVGIVVDSMLFLSLAFGSLDFLWGLVIEKGWSVIAALPFIHLLRIRDRRIGLTPV